MIVVEDSVGGVVDDLPLMILLEELRCFKSCCCWCPNK